MPRARLFTLGLVLVLPVACATSAIDIAPPRADAPWQPNVSAVGVIEPGRSGAAPETGTATAGHSLPVNTQLLQPRPTVAIDARHVHGLAELIDLAQRNNPQTQRAWNMAREAALAVGIARSTYLPRLTLAALGGYRWANDQFSGIGSATLQTPNSGSGSVAAAALNWLLFDFGRRDALIEATGQAAVASNIGFTEAHQQVIYDVTLAFYAHDAARTRHRIATESLRNSETVLTVVAARLRQGEATSVDQAQANQAVAQARLAQIQARGAEQNAYLHLVTAIGLPPNSAIRVADQSRRSFPADAATLTQDAIARAIARRPDVLAAYALERASEANIRAAASEFLPRVFASGNVSYASGNLNLTAIPSVGEQLPSVNLSQSRLGSVIMGGVSVPIYDGGTRAALLRQAQARAASASLARQRRQDEAARQIVLADNALRTSLAAHRASAALVQAAETSFAAALAAYRGGMGAVTAVTMADTALLQARLGQAEAHNAVLTAAASLALATGSIGEAPR